MRPRKGTHALLASLALGALTLGIALPESAQAQGPTQTITVSFKDKEIASILDFIATRTGYKITYEPEVRTGGYKATVSFDSIVSRGARSASSAPSSRRPPRRR